MKRAFVLSEKHTTFSDKKVPMFLPDTVLADAETVALRLLVCNEPCRFNQSGVCRQCCAGVPIPVLVRLAASRCGKGYW